MKDFYISKIQMVQFLKFTNFSQLQEPKNLGKYRHTVMFSFQMPWSPFFQMILFSEWKGIMVNDYFKTIIIKIIDH